MVKNPPAKAGDTEDMGSIPWRKKWQPNPVLLPGKSQGQSSLVGYSPWGCKELDTTEQLHFTSLPESHCPWVSIVILFLPLDMGHPLGFAPEAALEDFGLTL